MIRVKKGISIGGRTSWFIYVDPAYNIMDAPTDITADNTKDTSRSVKDTRRSKTSEERHRRRSYVAKDFSTGL